LYRADVVKEPLRYVNGYLLVPDGPGLGVEVDEVLLAEHTTDVTMTFGTDLVGLLDRTSGSDREK
jgi:hypothetical protein